MVRAHRLFVVALALAFLPPSQGRAEAAHYQAVKEKSALKFFAIRNDEALQGGFTDYSADIVLDVDKPEASTVHAEVNTASVVMQDKEALDYVTLPDWLSVKAFPKATLKVPKLSRMPSSMNFYGDGELTVRGVTKPVSVNFRIEHMDDEGAVAKGYFTLRRTGFGVGQGQWSRDDVIKDEVRVEFRIYAKKQ